ELAKAENECMRCPLYKDATQAVPGEGRKGSHVMLVGEQPGDKERPDRQAVRRPRRPRSRPSFGGRRNPARGGLRDQCSEALQARDARQAAPAQASERSRNRALQDLARYRTRDREAGGVVALGATAARSLLGRSVTITKARSQTLRLADGTAAFVTIHPSY